MGGSPAQHGNYPHLVSLQSTDRGNKHLCGASIIDPLLLLSAAHCFEQYDCSNCAIQHTRAVAGDHNLNVPEGPEQIRDVIWMFRHDDYNEMTFENDIVLLVLNESLHIDDEYVRSIQLWDSSWSLPSMKVDYSNYKQ